MNNKQVMQEALELIKVLDVVDYLSIKHKDNTSRVTALLNKAIDEYDTQEPVAWINRFDSIDSLSYLKTEDTSRGGSGEYQYSLPLYIHPKKELSETRWTPAFIIPEKEGRFYGISSLGLVDICRYTNGEWHKMSDGSYCQFYKPSYVQKKELSDDDIKRHIPYSETPTDDEFVSFARAVLKAASGE